MTGLILAPPLSTPCLVPRVFLVMTPGTPCTEDQETRTWPRYGKIPCLRGVLGGYRRGAQSIQGDRDQLEKSRVRAAAIVYKMRTSSRRGYYAVILPGEQGRIYRSWEETKVVIHRRRCIHKKFWTMHEARIWINERVAPLQQGEDETRSRASKEGRGGVIRHARASERQLKPARQRSKMGTRRHRVGQLPEGVEVPLRERESQGMAVGAGETRSIGVQTTKELRAGRADARQVWSGWARELCWRTAEWMGMRQGVT